MARRNSTKGSSRIRTEHAFAPAGLAPRIGWQAGGIHWSQAFRRPMTGMGDTGKRNLGKKIKRRRDHIFHQRVAIRIRYSKRGRPGQWKAHGHYIPREGETEGQTGCDRTWE